MLGSDEHRLGTTTNNTIGCLCQNFLFLLRANDYAERVDNFLSVVQRFLLGDTTDFKIFSTSNLLAPRSRVWITRLVKTKKHLFGGK
jgi:hypothetical protein